MHSQPANRLPKRRATRPLWLGGVQIGGGSPVVVQSMTNSDTRDVDATLEQIRALAALGCQVVRVATPDERSTAVLPAILAQSPIPVVADIHFDHRLALAAIAAGVHGIRINPGNIPQREDLAAIAQAAAERGTAVRIGVNGGSLSRETLVRHGGPTPAAMVDSAVEACQFFEDHGCRTLKVSLKTSRVDTTVESCRLFARRSDLPLHLGVTEAGTPRMGVVKSAIGIGALLLDGIGDTIRVSLTAHPCEEIPVALAILEATGYRTPAPDIVSCPTCGRTEVDLMGLTQAVEAEIARLKALGWTFDGVTVAVMGCVVNGPGEAREATLGIAGGKGKAVIFRAGNVVATAPENELVAQFADELRKIGAPPETSGNPA